MKKQAWLFLNLWMVLLLGGMGNSAEAIESNLTSPTDEECLNVDKILLQVKITDGSSDVTTAKFWIDQTGQVKQGNNADWHPEPGDEWNFSQDIPKNPDNPSIYEAYWDVRDISDQTYRLTYWLIPKNGDTHFGEKIAFRSDCTAPYGSITSPSNSQTITGDKIPITASANDDLSEVHWVKFWLTTPGQQKGNNPQWETVANPDFPFVYTDYSSPWSPPDWDMTDILDGEVTITIWVGDKADNEFHQPVNERVTVHVDRAPPTHTISGYVRTEGESGISGVTVSLTGAQSKNDTTNSEGFYEFKDLSGGNYTVTPSKSAYTFNPVSLSYNPLNADQTNQSFTGYPPIYYSISGYVQNNEGNGISKVTISLSGAKADTYTTGSNGY